MRTLPDSKYGHSVYIGVYAYMLCQFDVWCITVHVYFLNVYIRTRQMRVSDETPCANLYLLPYSY
jgi:hypothetical protein